MDDDKILWGGVGAITAMYGFFIKHLIKHADRDEIIKLKESVQYKDNCGEIVKRLEEKFEPVHDKLDAILEHMPRRKDT